MFAIVQSPEPVEEETGFDKLSLRGGVNGYL